MALTWLHISDFHIKTGDPYDRDVVLRALVRAVERYRTEEGRRADLIFATGDIAHGGQAGEYDRASPFFDALLAAAGVTKERLFVIPGNHDVDRRAGQWLVRTLGGREEADAYFAPGHGPKPHAAKFQAFAAWHDGYFAGLRRFPVDTTCAPPDTLEVKGHRLAILRLNSALFCQDDQDHGKLWLGRRCLDAGLDPLAALGAELTVALVHHPLDWLHEAERGNVRATLQDRVDLILRGHLHETEAETVAGTSGDALHIAAGASYQTRNWPNRALFATYDGAGVTLFPIRYEDHPREVWTLDPSLLPKPPFTLRFELPRRRAAPRQSAPPPEPEPARSPIPSNVPIRGNRPFEGRDDLLRHLMETLADLRSEKLVVLRGPPGIGKSELAQEYARLHRSRYTGGSFVLDAGEKGIAVGLAGIGRRLPGAAAAADRSLDDQAHAALAALGAAPTLLIYDAAASPEVLAEWLPAAGVPCHVIATSTRDTWDPRWVDVEVPALPVEAALDIVRAIAGPALAARHGGQLVAASGGLPVQIVPGAAALRMVERRGGSLEAVTGALVPQAQSSFERAYRLAGPEAQLLLRGAAQFNPLAIPREELRMAAAQALGWTEAAFARQLDACAELHLLQLGPRELRMHQLFAGFVRGAGVTEANAPALPRLLRCLAARMVALAGRLGQNPNQPAQAALLLAFRPELARWDGQAYGLSVADGETVSRALRELGAFAEALPWFERAVAEKEKGDVHGRVDPESLSRSLHELGVCLSRQGKHAEALPWFERAVAASKKGDVDGQVDPESLGTSLHELGFCLSQQGKHAEALPWFEQAVAASEKGDVDGRVDSESLGASLHLVGVCLSRQGKHAEALPWYQRAVAASEKGDVHERVDPESLGRSLHEVGICLSQQGNRAEALPWYERAVAEKQRGDVHERVDPESLGLSLHEVGICLSQQGNHAEALLWYERAVAEKQKGDVHGRVDPESLGRSLHEVGVCLSQQSEDAEALPWFERAVAEKQKGDVHGRVDPASLGHSLHSSARTLRRLGRDAEAEARSHRAASLTAQQP